MACSQNGTKAVSKGTIWECKSPRILDVIFSMPETAVYSGGDIRVNIYYSADSPQIETENEYEHVDVSHVYSKENGAAELFSLVNVTHSSSLVEEIGASSSYTLEHMSDLAMKLDTGVRLGTFLISICFVIYWCHSMGIKGLCCFPKKNKGKKGIYLSSICSCHLHLTIFV
jgi:hypothetical protein